MVRHTPEVSLPNTLTVSFPGAGGRAVWAHATGLAATTGSTSHRGPGHPLSYPAGHGPAPLQLHSAPSDCPWAVPPPPPQS
jgi:hypothetical protein